MRIIDSLTLVAVRANVAGAELAAAKGKVCPKAPPGAQGVTNEVTAYVLWGVIAIFGLAVVIGIGSIVAGRMFSMPHASKAGVISLVVILCCGIAYGIVPQILNSVLGGGCI